MAPARLGQLKAVLHSSQARVPCHPSNRSLQQTQQYTTTEHAPTGLPRTAKVEGLRAQCQDLGSLGIAAQRHVARFSHRLGVPVNAQAR